MARRKRKATTPASISVPKKRAVRRSARLQASPDAQQPTATDAAAAAAAAPSLNFTDLPFHFLVQMVDKMTYSEMASFRLSCKKAREAVDHWGRSQRSLDIRRLVRELWPDHSEAKRDFKFDSLKPLENELVKLSQWMDFDLITSIDFEGVGTMNPDMLEAVFGSCPRPNVKRLNLVDTIIQPYVWTALSHHFPAVKSVRWTEDAAHFPEEIVREIEKTVDKKLPAHTLVDQKRLVETGHLDKERIVTLRCLKRLFPTVQYMRVE